MCGCHDAQLVVYAYDPKTVCEMCYADPHNTGLYPIDGEMVTAVDTELKKDFFLFRPKLISEQMRELSRLTGLPIAKSGMKRIFREKYTQEELDAHNKKAMEWLIQKWED